MLAPQRDVSTILSSPDHHRFRGSGGSTAQSYIAVLLGGQKIRRVIQVHDIRRYHDLHVSDLRAESVTERGRSQFAFVG